MARVALTTTDNPYNPLKDFEKWFLFDMQKGYNTCAYLDRMSETNDLMSQEEYDEEIESTIDRIVDIDPLHLYIKVKSADQQIETGVPE